MITIICLIAPCGPSLSHAAREQFKVWTGRTRFDDLVLLIGFARVLSLPSSKVVHLSSTRTESASVAASDAEQKKLGDVPEIEADASSI